MCEAQGRASARQATAAAHCCCACARRGDATRDAKRCCCCDVCISREIFAARGVAECGWIFGVCMCAAAIAHARRAAALSRPRVPIAEDGVQPDERLARSVLSRYPRCEDGGHGTVGAELLEEADVELLVGHRRRQRVLLRQRRDERVDLLPGGTPHLAATQGQKSRRRRVGRGAAVVGVVGEQPGDKGIAVSQMKRAVAPIYCPQHGIVDLRT